MREIPKALPIKETNKVFPNIKSPRVPIMTGKFETKFQWRRNHVGTNQLCHCRIDDSTEALDKELFQRGALVKYHVHAFGSECARSAIELFPSLAVLRECFLSSVGGLRHALSLRHVSLGLYCEINTSLSPNRTERTMTKSLEIDLISHSEKASDDFVFWSEVIADVEQLNLRRLRHCRSLRRVWAASSVGISWLRNLGDEELCKRRGTCTR